MPQKLRPLHVFFLTILVIFLAGFFFMRNGSMASAAAALGFSGGPFGGQVSQIKKCQGGSIYAEIKSALGGTKKVIWTPGTKTYDYGPIKHPGQWVLGMLGGSTTCVLGPKQTISGQKITILGTGR